MWVLQTFLVLAAVAPGQPETVGFSPARLEHVVNFVAREIGEQRIAGAVTLIARRDEIVLFEAAGFWVDPKEDLILIFMTNSTPFDLHQRWYFKTAVYQALDE